MSPSCIKIRYLEFLFCFGKVVRPEFEVFVSPKVTHLILENEMDGSDMTTDSIPDGHKIIQEGLAKILYPADEDGDVPVSTPQRNLIGPRRPRWSAQVQLLNFFTQSTILGILQSGTSI